MHLVSEIDAADRIDGGVRDDDGEPKEEAEVAGDAPPGRTDYGSVHSDLHTKRWSGGGCESPVLAVGRGDVRPC